MKTSGSASKKAELSQAAQICTNEDLRLFCEDLILNQFKLVDIELPDQDKKVVKSNVQ